MHLERYGNYVEKQIREKWNTILDYMKHEYDITDVAYRTYKQGIVNFCWRFCHSKSCCMGEAVVWSNDEGIKRVLWI